MCSSDLKERLRLQKLQRLQKLNNSKPRQEHVKTLKMASRADVKVKAPHEKLQKGHGVQFHGKLSKQFHKVFEEERQFIANVMKRVPKVGHNEENLEDYLLESDESEVELSILTKSTKKRKHVKNGSSLDDVSANAEEIDTDSDDTDNEAKKRRQFLQSLEAIKQNKKVKSESEEVSREELKARLAAKLEAIRKGEAIYTKVNLYSDSNSIRSTQRTRGPQPNPRRKRRKTNNRTIRRNRNSLFQSQILTLRIIRLAKLM